MKKNSILLFFLLVSMYASAQKATLKGVITDTASRQNLYNSTITLLHAKDSILYKFTRSDGKGNFIFENLDSGKYVLLITYPNYADFVDELSFTDTSQINLAKIVLTLKANLLKDVIVNSVAGSIKIKGDTTEFAADSFKVQPNATVEDLLKKLPGIQVDKNGNITAQGEKVQKVLVDGEEFFGDDPTLVTQNLRADMVDKVQVYDKQSDQAAFTGIDDGQKEKTINLKLKDNKKNGYFGKANLGAGTNGYHDNQLMFNSFKGKQKFAVYGIVSNTGTSGLNWQDQSTYGDNPLANADVDEGGGIYINFGYDELDSWDGRYNGQGMPLVQSGGLHYSNKWDDDKQSLNANYKILNLHVDGESGTRSQTILSDTTYFNNDKQISSNQILRNRINGSYEYQFDSSSSVKLSVDGGVDHKITNLLDSSEARASDSSLVNNAHRATSTTGDNRSFNSNLLWKKKFKKKGRTLSFNLREEYINNSSEGNLFSKNNYYLKGALISDTLTDQYKTNDAKGISLNSKLTYTEPLNKVSSIIFSYGFIVSHSESLVNSFNKGNDNKYSDLDSLYSNHYLFNILTNSGGVNYSLFQKKFKLNIGTDIGYSAFHQTNKFNDSVLIRKFANWYPKANLSYQFTPRRRLSFWYNGYTDQPEINQIQPVLTNTDPLNITIGNPSLKPAFRNNMRLSFSDYKVLTNQYIYVGLNSGFVLNNISNKSYVDSFGRTINQYVNLNGNRSYGVHLSYGFKLKKLDMNMNSFSDLNFGRYTNIVNNAFNATQSNDYTFGIGFYKSKEKKYDISFNPSATYTTSVSSIQESVKTHYWSFDADPSLHIYFAKKYQVQTDCDFNLKQRTSVFANNVNVILWNAWIGRTFTKKDALLVKITGHDLLDQNMGFNRTVNSNFISENTYNVIKRFFLLSVTWNINKTGSKTSENN
ncbi:outer membrane beta-barrel protein [Parafilimonas sp.]|uniref:outer membrane beta-barrel protein n=1 Tax=Parafilimonas sp. TaxID=1969739 RepID=UPI0039E258AE